MEDFVVSHSLARWQAVVLGAVVVAVLAVGAWGLAQIGGKSNLFRETFEVVVYLPDAQDVEKGAPVKIRGIEAGKVVAVEHSDDDEEGMVRLRLELDKRYDQRIFADASASVVSKGLLGTSFVTIQPGKPAAGPRASNVIRGQAQPDLAEATAKLASAATRVDNLLASIERGEGTAGMLVKDDSLYRDIKVLTEDLRTLVANTNAAVTSLREDAQQSIGRANTTLANIETEMTSMKDLVRTSKEAITAVKHDAEAIKSMPIVRSYITDEVKVLVRPNFTKDRVVYQDVSFFDPASAVLTEMGRKKVGECAAWLRGQKQKGSDIVVASFADPSNKSETSVSARELTKKRSEAVAALLREYGAAKMGTFSSRDITPVGLGVEAPPYVESEDVPAARVEIILFMPR